MLMNFVMLQICYLKFLKDILKEENESRLQIIFIQNKHEKYCILGHMIFTLKSNS